MKAKTRHEVEMTGEPRRVPKGKDGQVPGPLKPDGTWDWVDSPRDEVAWLDERIRVVREIAMGALHGNPMEMHMALSTIIQQLAGVSRATSAKTDE